MSEPLHQPRMRFGKRGDSDLAQRCADARKRVIAFFDWAGHNCARNRSDWETWATRRVHDGWTPEAVHEHVKRRWIEHRRAINKPMRLDMPTTEEVHSIVYTIAKGLVGTTDWLACEPWWERVGQHEPVNHGPDVLNANRRIKGLLMGPPWIIKNPEVDRYWFTTDDDSPPPRSWYEPGDSP